MADHSKGLCVCVQNLMTCGYVRVNLGKEGIVNGLIYNALKKRRFNGQLFPCVYRIYMF